MRLYYILAVDPNGDDSSAFVWAETGPDALTMYRDLGYAVQPEDGSDATVFEVPTEKPDAPRALEWRVDLVEVWRG